MKTKFSIPVLAIVFAVGFGAGILFSAWKLERLQPRDESPVAHTRAPSGPASDQSPKIAAREKAVEAAPDNPEALAALAEAYFSAGDFEKAATGFERALRLKPDSADIAAQWGMSLRKLHKGKEAADAFQQALKIDPGHALALFNLGLVYRDELKDPAAALKTWEIFLEKAGNAPHAVMIQPWVTELREKVKQEKSPGQ